MPRVYIPSSIIQGMKVTSAAKQKQAGSILGSSNIGRCWRQKVTLVTMAKGINSYSTGDTGSPQVTMATETEISIAK